MGQHHGRREGIRLHSTWDSLSIAVRVNQMGPEANEMVVLYEFMVNFFLTVSIL